MKCPSFKKTNLFANIQGTGYKLALLIVVLLTWELGKKGLAQTDHFAATKEEDLWESTMNVFQTIGSVVHFRHLSQMKSLL